MTRAEYLSRPLIEGVTYTLEADHIKIECPHTTFLQCRAPLHFWLSETLALLKELETVAGTNEGVILKGAGALRKRLKALHPMYEKQTREMQDLFCQISALTKTLQNDGLHTGYGDDALYNHIFSIYSELKKYDYATTPHSGYIDAHTHIQTLLERREWERLEPGETITYILK